MVKHCFCFILFSLFLLAACDQAPDADAPVISPLPSLRAESRIIDSFTVEGIRSKYEFKDMLAVDDSTLVSYSHETNEISCYVRQKGSKHYLFKSAVLLPVDHLPYAFFQNVKGGYTVIDAKRVFYYLDKKFHVIARDSFGLQMPYLKNNYVLIRATVNPVAQLQDTMIIRYMGTTLEHKALDLKEHSLLECVYRHGQVQQPRFYFEKPANLKDYSAQAPIWNFHDNRIDLLWRCFDTLYTYDRTQRKYEKHAIHNPFFRQPEPYDWSLKDKPSYNSYDTKYFLHNFEYLDFYFNETTQHYAFTYQPPITDTFQLRRPTHTDKAEYTLVLDKAFRIVGNYKTERRYWMPFLSFMIPGKGHVRALFQDPDNLHLSKFYVFSF